MSDLKTRLGLNVFKPLPAPHIRIRPGMERDPRLRAAVRACPAGLYEEGADGVFTLTIDGCLECGTEVLEWGYPEGGAGVQFRFG